MKITFAFFALLTAVAVALPVAIDGMFDPGSEIRLKQADCVD